MLTTIRGRATVAGLDPRQEYLLQVMVLNGTQEKLIAKRRFTGKTVSTRKPFECSAGAQADLVLLVDGSWSIGRTNFRKVRDFLEGLAVPFHIGPQGVQIALSQYSGDPRTEWHLNNFTSREPLLEAIRNFRYKGGNTFTGQALIHALENNLKKEVGARPNTPQFLLLLTDGKSQDDAIAAANRLKNAGIEIIAIGVKNADEAELRQVASEPLELNVYNVNDFPLLSKLVGRLARILCGKIEDRIKVKILYVSFILSVSQVEVKGVNTVLLQNLSSLSRYLVSVQSLYEKGLSTPITANLTVDGESEGAILEEVEEDKEYQISLSALYADGAQSEAVAIRYSTLSGGGPSSLSISEETAVSMLVTWVHPNSHVLQYRVSYTPLNGDVRENTVSLPGSERHVLLQNLLPDTRYSVLVTAEYRNREGGSASAQGKTSFDMMEAFGLTQRAHSTIEGVAAEPFIFSTLPSYTLYRDVQLTQSTSFIHPAGFSPEHTISTAFRLLQDSPREPFALWQLTDNDFQPKMGVVLDPEKKVLLYFSLDYRGEIQELTFDQPQVHSVFYGSFHKVCVSVSLSVDCQRVGERPARPLGTLPTDGFEMLGKLVRTRGPHSGSAAFQLQSFEIVCNTTWVSEDNCCDLPSQRDEESCPAPAYACTCTTDVPGAPGDTGPPGPPGARGEKGDIGSLSFIFVSINCPQGTRGMEGNIGSPGIPGPRGFQGMPGHPGPVGERGPLGSVGPTGLSGSKGERGEKGEPQSLAMIYQLVTQACEKLVHNEVLKLDAFLNEMNRKPVPIQEPVAPPGEPGIPGGRGPPGSRGPQGRQGSRGESGKPGYPGEQGKP
uniref:Collagen alpha-1(XX) chain-like n=1 Tax=Sinocyclocheilus grahami TaxID=75366 RepID=A0A672M4Y4_SINGR